MTILCRVCAEFRYPDGSLIHKVGPAERNMPHQAPDNISLDPLFALLESDGSLTAVTTKAEQKKLENMDPTAGVDASGKRIQPEPADPESNAVSAESTADNLAAKQETKSTGTNTASASAKTEAKTTGRTRKTAGQ